MWQLLDTNNDGRVNFLEFCSFMGQCNEEFERVKNRKSVLRARPSKANFKSEELEAVATLAARRLSHISKRNLPVDNSGAMETVDEEGGNKKDETRSSEDPTQTAWPYVDGGSKKDKYPPVV